MEACPLVERWVRPRTCDIWRSIVFSRYDKIQRTTCCVLWSPLLQHLWRLAALQRDTVVHNTAFTLQSSLQSVYHPPKGRGESIEHNL